ncbi:MAG: hypothetical protein IPM94_04475 [bacterium]|nr:hypothetical protein [bacterium]
MSPCPWNRGWSPANPILAALAAALVAAGGAGGCAAPAAPPAPPPPGERTVAGTYPAALRRLAPAPAGTHRWTWRAAGSVSTGPATLTVAGGSWTWRLATTPGDTAPPDTLLLRPADPDLWHEFRVAARPDRPDGWLPLPRVAVASAHYADLLHLVQELTRPRFDGVVTRWALQPVPVGCGPAVSGAVDLAACLREAVGAWSLDGEPPLLAWDAARPPGPGSSTTRASSCTRR